MALMAKARVERVGQGVTGACIALVVIAFYCINQYFEGRSEAVAGGRSYTD